MGRRAFFNCTLLENINVPRSLVSIEDGAFYNCRSLKEMIIPDTLRRLGSRAFSGCIGMEKLSISRRTKLGEHPFMGISGTITFRD
ncbi:MAG: leucine-rich repeat domain-containing protein [Treponema sp.]|nr:leucine-rich repeat domain-containing protein [Treponema sp.]